MMRLKVKRVNLSSGGPFVAILNIEDANKFDLRALDRIKLKKIVSDKEIVATIDISTKGIKKGEVGLFEEVLSALDLKEGVGVEAHPSRRPKSIDYIKKKLDGKRLSKKELNEIIKDITNNNLSEVELTYFVSGSYTEGLDMKEIVDLTRIMIDNGFRLKLKKDIILDKHSAGGVPGNRTSMIIVPIIAAAGYTIPKTSSRAITSAAGTSDVMEVLAPVKISHEKIKRVVKKTNGCLVWQSSINPHGADEKMIKVRHPLRLDPEGLLISSILAKKKAVGATHILLDLPYGEGAKMTKNEAKILKKKFIKFCKILEMKIKVILTDGSQPIGNGIGAGLEAKDVLDVLQGFGPSDLREKAIFMASEMLNMVGVKNANKKVIEILDSGKAYEKMLEIIREQGGKKNISLPKADHIYPIKAKNKGIVKCIKNKQVVSIARRAGSPDDKAAGIYLFAHKNYYVKKGEVLYTIHAENQDKLDYAVETASKDSGFVIETK